MRHRLFIRPFRETRLTSFSTLGLLAFALSYIDDDLSARQAGNSCRFAEVGACGISQKNRVVDSSSSPQNRK